jgi:hypothetical protein
MKDWQYHLINAGIAGLLVTFGSLTPVLTGDGDFKAICVGVGLGVITGTIVFLNKMQEWITTQDPDCPKNLKLLNFL